MSVRERASEKRSLGFNSSDVLVSSVGHLHPWKNPLGLLRGLSPAFKRISGLKLVLVGQGPLESAVSASVVRNGLKGRVRILSRVSDSLIDRLYTASDIFASAATNEGFGIAVADAMGHGVPVIVARAGAYPELVGDCGFLFKTSVPEEISDYVLQLAGNPALSSELGRSGQRRVEKLFSWDTSARLYSELYGRILAEFDGD